MCDPIIDEHFRRSLGKDYVMLFSNNNKNAEPVSRSPEKPASPVKELLDMDNPGMSVDDHFAKALGDTWFKLNQKDPRVQAQPDIKPSPPTEKQSVVSL